MPSAEAAQGKSRSTRGWWNKAWPYRRGITVQPAKGKNHEAFLYLPACGVSRPDGRDIVVTTSENVPVPCKVISAGHDDSAFLVFKLLKGVLSYYAYFGNRRAKETVKTWEPNGGLTLEVRALGEGRADSLDDLYALLRNSPRVLGRDIRLSTALALNPFGPQEGYIVIFSGLLNIREPGEHFFAVNSRDACFALIDGKLVASWPGRHEPDPWDYHAHSGVTSLSPGYHKLTLYNVAFGRGGCTLGLQAPSWKAIRTVQGGLLVPIAEGQAHGLETANQKPFLDFIWRFTGDLGREGFEATRLKFIEATPHLKQPYKSCRFTFGDGQAAEGGEVDHVFLKNGIYTVTMALTMEGGRVMKTQRSIRIQPQGLLRPTGKDYAKQSAAEFVRLSSKYDLKQYDRKSLATLVRLARGVGDDHTAMAALEGLFSRDPPLDDHEIALDALEYGRWLVAKRSAYDAALQIFLRVAHESQNRKTRTMGALAASEISLFYLGEVDAAEALLLSIPGRPGTLERRWLGLRLAGVHLARGEVEKALAIYGQIEAGPKQKRRMTDPDFRLGDSQTTFHYYLRVEDLTAAEASLRAWEAEMPAASADGTIPLAWVELMTARKQWRPAIRQLEWTLLLAPESNRVPAVYLRLGQCHENAGDRGAARRFYQRILDGHPLAPEFMEARRMLAKKP